MLIQLNNIINNSNQYITTDIVNRSKLEKFKQLLSIFFYFTNPSFQKIIAYFNFYFPHT